MDPIGVVVIGRNEGERLRQCLASVVGQGYTVVYVDSGSTDGSVELAVGMGVAVVELDRSRPFTAAWARNTGVEHLLSIRPDISYIQFVDGDCEILDGWIECARHELETHPDWAVVCGRLRERHPERSIYNRLADLEWDTPTGEVRACGGIALMRTKAFQQAGGFNPSLIAGEEPELCVRFRRHGWKIERLGSEMALHDIAMTRFGQWWRRVVRGGHAIAEGSALHGRSQARHCVRESRSILFWGVMLPTSTIGLAWPMSGASLVLLCGYPLLYYRIRQRSMRRGFSRADASVYALFCVLGKFPQAIGLNRFWLTRILGKRTSLIEYKDKEYNHK